MHISAAFTVQSAKLAAVGGALIGTLCVCRVIGKRGVLPSATPVPLVTPSLILGGYLVSKYLAPEGLMVDVGVSNAASSSKFALVASAALVGAGAKLGEGCTSGNGINGLAAMSKASLVFVATFMAAGAVAASMSASSVRIDVAAGDVDFPSKVIIFALMGIGAQFLQSGASYEKGKFPTRAAHVAADVGAGLAFASALCISGMAKKSKVLGFLDFAGEAGWDPSLMLVMGGALLVAFPTYQIMGLAREGSPYDISNLAVWTKRPINMLTVVSGIFFGCGWGLSGMCPGPALVNTGLMSTDAAIFSGVMFLVRPVVEAFGNLQRKKD
mmetsp:Transcript_68784/g.138281  ORF Transcript_68784/g.138281 Transcript_68784/m.138281 type:complete len:327 (+) Transcript_68784:86-1066(+)